MPSNNINSNNNKKRPASYLLKVLCTGHRMAEVGGISNGKSHHLNVHAQQPLYPCEHCICGTNEIHTANYCIQRAGQMLRYDVVNVYTHIKCQLELLTLFFINFTQSSYAYHNMHRVNLWKWRNTKISHFHHAYVRIAHICRGDVMLTYSFAVCCTWVFLFLSIPRTIYFSHSPFYLLARIQCIRNEVLKMYGNLTLCHTRYT